MVLLAKVVMHFAVDIVLQEMLPCKVVLLVVLLKSVMMADAMASFMAVQVCPKVIVAASYKRDRQACEWCVWVKDLVPWPNLE